MGFAAAGKFNEFDNLCRGGIQFAEPPELYRITYDGSINDEPHYVVMGGTTEPIANALKDSYAKMPTWPTLCG